jgi:hypothetical protein
MSAFMCLPYVLLAYVDTRVPARAIQEVAGHRDLTTTQRGMHLSPAAIESAIRLIDRGNSVATAATGTA